MFLQVVFEGIRGNGIYGDIALDDISTTPGPCPIQGDCDFENGLCTWMNVHAGDNFDWNLGKGGTSSAYTGPSADHTKGTSAGNSFLVHKAVKTLYMCRPQYGFI